MPKVKEYEPKYPDGTRLIGFHCPACGYDHAFRVGGTQQPQWTFNEDFAKPTFSPSLLVYDTRDGQRVTLCHSHVTKGQMIFCTDNPHKLNGQTVDLAEFDDS